MNTAQIIYSAIERSVSHNERAVAKVGKASETAVVNALHNVDGYLDRATEADGSLDVWGGEAPTEWRIRVVFS